MIRIIKFIISDIVRNKLVLFYTIILAFFAWSIFGLEDNAAKGALSLLNVILLAVPLVSMIFSTIYMFNSSEFIELMVSQPIKRKVIWTGLFLSLIISLNLSFLVGVSIPILLFSANGTGMVLILSGMLITTIFTSLAVLCSIITRDKAKGIGLAIVIWLFLTLIYDGIVLFLMFQFSDYPIEKAMVVATAFNPIDLARILVILQVDVSALMGYTGAIFKSIFGSSVGLIISFLLLLLWIVVPFVFSLIKFKNKDL